MVVIRFSFSSFVMAVFGFSNDTNLIKTKQNFHLFSFPLEEFELKFVFFYSKSHFFQIYVKSG